MSQINVIHTAYYLSNISKRFRTLPLLHLKNKRNTYEINFSVVQRCYKFQIYLTVTNKTFRQVSVLKGIYVDKKKFKRQELVGNGLKIMLLQDSLYQFGLIIINFIEYSNITSFYKISLAYITETSAIHLTVIWLQECEGNTRHHV